MSHCTSNCDILTPISWKHVAFSQKTFCKFKMCMPWLRSIVIKVLWHNLPTILWWEIRVHAECCMCYCSKFGLECIPCRRPIQNTRRASDTKYPEHTLQPIYSISRHNTDMFCRRFSGSYFKTIIIHSWNHETFSVHQPIMVALNLETLHVICTCTWWNKDNGYRVHLEG